MQTHVSSLLTKLHADNRAGLIIAAHTLGHTPLRSTESTQPGAGKVGLHASPIDIED